MGPEPSTSTTDGPSTSSRDGRPHPLLVAGLAALALAGIVSGLIQLAVLFGNAEIRRSNEISGCRAAYRVELVDGPTYRALKASTSGDDEALAAAVADGDPDRYERLVDLSNRDPEAFLRACRVAGP